MRLCSEARLSKSVYALLFTTVVDGSVSHGRKNFHRPDRGGVKRASNKGSVTRLPRGPRLEVSVKRVRTPPLQGLDPGGIASINGGSSIVSDDPSDASARCAHSGILNSLQL